MAEIQMDEIQIANVPVPNVPAVNVQPRPWLERGAEIVGASLYTGPELFFGQLLIGFLGGVGCASMTKHKSKTFETLTLVALVVGMLFFLFLSFYIVACRMANTSLVHLHLWSRYMVTRYKIILYILRGLGIVGILRLFVLLGDLICGVEKDIDGFAISTFLFGYLIIVSWIKLFGIHGEFCVSDSLLATAIMLEAKFESGANKSHIPRIIFTYLASVLLVCFRLSKTPYEVAFEIHVAQLLAQHGDQHED